MIQCQFSEWPLLVRKLFPQVEQDLLSLQNNERTYVENLYANRGLQLKRSTLEVKHGFHTQLHQLQVVSCKVILSKTQLSHWHNRANQLLIQIQFSLRPRDRKHLAWSVNFIKLISCLQALKSKMFYIRKVYFLLSIYSLGPCTWNLVFVILTITLLTEQINMAYRPIFLIYRKTLR